MQEKKREQRAEKEDEAELCLKSLSHNGRVSQLYITTTNTSQQQPSSPSQKHVHFASCTIDIVSALVQRHDVRFTTFETKHCRPILKYTPDTMSGYLRKAGTTFARALNALGAWCTGVTSTNPNVRSDHYKQIVAQIRGSSPLLKEAAESALYQNVHGLWVQLVEDFSIRREEYVPRDNVLYENAAQLIGIILSNHRVLEKLDVLDIETLILEILTRVDQHLDNQKSLEDRFQSHLWLLGCEVSGWWEGIAKFYTEDLCRRLLNVLNRVEIQFVSSSIQISLLRIFRTVFSRYPDMEGLTFETILPLSWDLMWEEDDLIRKEARLVLALIGDYRGGQPEILNLLKPKLVSGQFDKDLCDKLKQELSDVKSIESAVELWIIITRLLRENLLDLGEDELKAWIQIAHDRFDYSKQRKSAGIMMTVMTYLCASKLDQNEKLYELFSYPYIQQYASAEWPLRTIDATMNGFVYRSPFYEKLAPGQDRPDPNLRAFARYTSAALDYPDIRAKDEHRETIDESIAHIFCHWDFIFRSLNDDVTFLQDCEEYLDIDRRRDILELSSIMARSMGFHLLDRYGRLRDRGKHATFIFWYNLMAMIINWDKTAKEDDFDIQRCGDRLKALRPLIVSGLNSLHSRVRQSTYRFMCTTTLLAGVKFLPEMEAMEILKAMDHARRGFEADEEDWFGQPVKQFYDYSAIVYDRFIEQGYIHHETPRPIVKDGKEAVEWVWTHYDQKDYPLGTVDVYDEPDKMRLEIFLRMQVILFFIRADKLTHREGHRLYKRETRKKPNYIDINKLIQEQREKKEKELKEFKKNQKELARRERLQKRKEKAAKKRGMPVYDPLDMSGISEGAAADKSSARQQGPSNSSPAGPSSDVSKSSQPEKMAQSSLQAATPPSSESSQKSSKSALVFTPATPETLEKLKKVNQIVNCLVHDAQKAESPAAIGSIVTGRRNQMDFREDSPSKFYQNDNEYRMRVAYTREGPERFGFLPQGWTEILNAPMESVPGDTKKRSRDEMEVETTEQQTTRKRRKLKSDYVPAINTTWKPAWLDKAQCYPVNKLGEDMSDVECLRGDELHRNADKMKLILETECMYVTSSRIDELVEIAKRNYASLRAIQAVYGNAKHANKQVRVERYQIV